MKKKIFAFTLSEVLVTLSILGVVAAITIPTLLKGYNSKIYSSQLKKVYSETSQGLRFAIVSKNATNLQEAGFNSQSGIQAFSKKNFNINKNCGTTGKGCFADKYKTLGAKTLYDYPTGSSCFATINGASLCISSNNIYVDVNGKDSPNIIGRDAFSMTIDAQGQLGGYSGSTTCKTNSSGWSGGYYCFQEILDNNWEMKY